MRPVDHEHGLCKVRNKTCWTRISRMGRTFSVILTEEAVLSVYSVYTVRAASTTVRDGKSGRCKATLLQPYDHKDLCTHSALRCSLVQSQRDFAMPVVNNVTRLLDSRKIQYAAYELPVEKLGALEAAQFLNVEPASVFKTIVVTREKPKKPLLVVVPSTATVDLKLLASSMGEKKVYLPTER